MEQSVPYHTIMEVSPISKWEPGQKYCLRIATIECHYLIQTNNVYLRDQWIHSIIWKVRNLKTLNYCHFEMKIFIFNEET